MEITDEEFMYNECAFKRAFQSHPEWVTDLVVDKVMGTEYVPYYAINTLEKIINGSCFYIFKRWLFNQPNVSFSSSPLRMRYWLRHVKLTFVWPYNLLSFILQLPEGVFDHQDIKTFLEINNVSHKVTGDFMIKLYMVRIDLFDLFVLLITDLLSAINCLNEHPEVVERTYNVYVEHMPGLQINFNALVKCNDEIILFVLDQMNDDTRVAYADRLRIDAIDTYERIKNRI